LVTKKTTIALLGCLAALIMAIGVVIGRIPQPQSYHDFTDQRTLLGLPNIWNVLSNLPFALGGIWGLFLLFSPGKVQFVEVRERWLWVGVAIGLILTAIGSSYYHLSPDNSRLVWDRLPMTIIFMSYVAALISERITIHLGLWLWPILLVIGVFSVLYWQASEIGGVGDLRFYLGLQVFTIFTTFVMLMAPSPYNRSCDLVVAIALFGIARLFEIFDKQIMLLTGGIISGHTLKHLAAGMAGIWLMRMLWKRKIVNSSCKKTQIGDDL